jgi:spore maturation protein CgeB
MPKDKLKKMGQNGKEYVIRYHNYDVLAKQFKEVLDGLENSAF